MIDAVTLLAAGGFAALAGLFAFLEVLPPLGRFVPGQLLVGAVAAGAARSSGSALPLVLAAFLGSLAGDLVNFVRARRHARWVLGGRHATGLPGDALDRLHRRLASNVVGTVLARRWFTGDRALMPWAAGAWNVPAFPYLAVNALACLAWAVAWVAAGFAFAYATRVLDPALSVILAITALMVVSRPFQNHSPRALWS